MGGRIVKIFGKLLAASAIAGSATVANATDLEVMHWWTSGGEAAAVLEFATAFDATGNNWVDSAIAGSGTVARPIMISRITGGNPPGAFQFNHGRQAEELIEAGLLRDLTDIAEAEGWKDIVNPPSILDGCTVDGKIYCAPVNIHSAQWMWLSNAAFEKAGVAIPADWNDFVAAVPELEAAGIIPLAMGQQGWQQNLAFQDLMVALLPDDIYLGVYGDKNAELAAGPEMLKVWEDAVLLREYSNKSAVQNWNDATNLVITGQAGAQIMGDWAQGEFAIAEQVAGEDYTCLPGLGLKEVLFAGGDSFYFPVLNDEAKIKAQGELAALLLKPETQVLFNLKKGSLPIRGDIDLSSANDCMKKGLEILAAGKTLPDQSSLLTQDTVAQLQDLQAEFFASDMSVADAQARFADIIADAE